MSEPSITIVVPSRDRPLRLRWLLNSLAEQDTEDFEIVVAHNSSGTETDELLATHPLAAAGRLRGMREPDGRGPAAMRNSAWRAGRAPLVLFTDDDCRAPAEWVSRALAAARAHPGAIVQGQTQPDPDELFVYHHAPHARSQEIVPPVDVAQTCNILYPRSLLEAVGGFDESFPQAVGEDTDLALRARDAGAEYVGAPEVLTYHMVEWGLRRRLRGTWRWQHMALVVRKHPRLREQLPLAGYAWKPAHVSLPLALAGALLALLLRRPALAPLAALPYIARTPLIYGRSPRGLARSASEVPGRAVIDAVEVAALIRGSIRHRSPLL